MQGDRASVGRDHHKDAYTIWMAGGGVKPGVSYGKTDELGYFPIENPRKNRGFMTFTQRYCICWA